MDRRSFLVPYHHFSDSHGSKRFVIDAAYTPASFFADWHSNSERLLVPEIDRRHAMKIGVAGAVAVAALSTAEKEAEAQVVQVLWWLTKTAAMAAGGWLITRVLDKMIGHHVDSAVESLTGVASTVRDLTESGSLYTPVAKTLVPLDKFNPNELHVVTSDKIKFHDKVIVPKEEVEGYKTPFGVDRRFTSIDPTLTLAGTTKIEAAKGFHQGEPLLPPDYRIRFRKNLVPELTKAFEKAKGLYNPDYDIVPDDVEWYQPLKDADYNEVYSFGLKEDIAKKAKVPVLLT